MAEIQIGTKHYNPEKSTLICRTPHGILYRKRGASTEFYLYNPEGKTNKEKITSVSWADANNLVKTYGSRELWLKYFTTYGTSTNPNDGNYVDVRLSAYYAIKARRNADLKHMNITKYICSLIDKDDSGNNYAHKSGKYDPT